MELKENERIERLKKENETVKELKKQMFNLMASICTDLTCQVRKRDMKLFNKGTK